MGEKRQDGFINTVIGHGLKSRDPLANTYFTAAPILTDQQLADMYYGNALVRRIIDLPADEAVKNWIHIEEDKEEKRAIQMLDDLNAEEEFANALRWSRLFGGAAILPIINDGGTFEDPVNEGSVIAIEELKVYDKREVIFEPLLFNDNPMDVDYGKPEYYQINPINGTPFYAHKSRVLIFDGDPLPSRERALRNYWGLPAMQGLFDAVRNNDDAHRLARLIMERMSQSVTKFDGLLEKLATEGGEKEIQARLQLIDMARSLLNTVAIDKEDEFQLFNMSLTNVPELIDRFGMYVAALTGIPYTMLFGRNTSGLNANDQSQVENWYSLVRRLQKRRLKSNLDRLVKLLQLAKKGLFRGVEMEKWCVEFNPLWMPTEKEQAETRKINAEADKAAADTATAYVNMGALDPSEVRRGLTEDYEIDPSINPVDPTPEELEQKQQYPGKENPEDNPNGTEEA